ncbi:MAG TPA: glutamyl-tRNA reductase [Myxococcaceae bacterium]
MELVCVGLSHQTAPLAVRERLAMTEPQRAQLLADWKQAPYEAMVVATCNRVEVYVVTPDARDTRARVRVELGKLGGPEVLEHLYEHEGAGALEHLFRGTSSLDSMVLGESQIQGQLKAAFAEAQQAGAARGMLSRVCAAAFACGKRVRTETAIGRASTCMASAAVALADRANEALAGKTVLVVGAGEMGALAARHLKQARIGRLIITNRTWARAEELASEVGGTARPFEELPRLLVEADVVVCSTASPLPLFTRESLSAVGQERGLRRLLMVDLSVPRNIAMDVAELDWVTAYDVDDIQRSVNENAAARAKEAQKAGAIVLQEVSRFMRDRAVRDGVPVLAQLRQHAEQIAQAEVERTLAMLGKDLTDRQRKSIEAMGRAIINKLLHEPTACLRTSAHADEGPEFAHTAARLFGLTKLAPVTKDF